MRCMSGHACSTTQQHQPGFPSMPVAAHRRLHIDAFAFTVKSGTAQKACEAPHLRRDSSTSLIMRLRSCCWRELLAISRFWRARYCRGAAHGQTGVQ
jgi:hypothetical protein